jgi:hypothetical protein
MNTASETRLRDLETFLEDMGDAADTLTLLCQKAPAPDIESLVAAYAAQIATRVIALKAAKS